MNSSSAFFRVGVQKSEKIISSRGTLRGRARSLTKIYIARSNSSMHSATRRRQTRKTQGRYKVINNRILVQIEATQQQQ